MRSKRFFCYSIILAVLLFGSLVTFAQTTGQLRGSVKLAGADGKPAPVSGATIDVYRTDLKGEFHTKSEKDGEWVFAGLPLSGTYIVAISAPGATPNAKGGVRVLQPIPVDVVLVPGDGKRLTMDEAKAVIAGGSTSRGGGESASDKAKREADIARNKEIAESNKKNESINEIVGRTFKEGNAALTAGAEAEKANKRDEALKLYGDAVTHYDTGLAADADQAALLTNKAAALKARGVIKYNMAIQATENEAKTSGIEAAKADFKGGADAANKAAELIKKESAATDPNDQKRQTANKYAAYSIRAEAMRLFVTKADPTQADAGVAAFQDYIAVETDPAKKARAQTDVAQMLLDVGAGDKAFAEYQKILAERPDDADANLGAGLALFSTGDKAKYQEAANFLQRFVDKAADTHKFKSDAKAILAELKSTENVVPEKAPARPPRRRP